MTRKLTRIFAATAVFGALTAATTAFAQGGTSPSPSHGAMPMTNGQGGMMNMMGQMNPDQMKQMTSMVENCNRMMESMTNMPAKPDKEPAPGSHG
ncbi:MAG TPA: hypothetical protein VH184_13805 [Dongiaceae bacterium]|nr:hypothetical protein [Dongiaceae bacterium]